MVAAVKTESALGRKLDELTTRKLRIGAGRGSLHRLVRPCRAYEAIRRVVRKPRVRRSLLVAA